MASARDRARSGKDSNSPKQSSPPPPCPMMRAQNSPSCSTRYFQKVESGAGVFAPVPGGSARESSISLVRKRRLPENEDKKASSKRARYESGSDASTVVNVESEEESMESERPHLLRRPGTPRVIRPRFERGAQPENWSGLIAPRPSRLQIQDDNAFVELDSDLSNFEHYQQAGQAWNQDQIEQEELCDSPRLHNDLHYTNLADADLTQLDRQRTNPRRPASTGNTPLRQSTSPLSGDEADFDIPICPDFHSRPPHRTNPPPQLRRTADQNSHYLLGEVVEFDDLYEAYGGTTASTDSQSYSSVAGPTLSLSTPQKALEEVEHPHEYSSRHGSNHPSNAHGRRDQIQTIDANHNLNNPEIERRRRGPYERLEQSSDDGFKSGSVADVPSEHRAGRDEDYTDVSPAARRSVHGQGHLEGQTVEIRDTTDTIMLALQLQIERYESELVRLRNEVAEGGSYPGRQVGHQLAAEAGGREQWEENREIVDQQSDDGSDAVYGQGFVAGQAEARRERGLETQTAYRAGYMASGEEMLGFIHRSAGREAFEYYEEHDDWL
ncbi:hypothetical protein Vi05172_g4220 [Venturia inaequalis]|nr:hypothetical protein Vi05172_g4220 [Venturia inaequalis]